MTPTIKTRHKSTSEVWIDIGDIMEVVGVQDQLLAIRLNLAPNDFPKADNLGTSEKPHNKK